MSRERFEASYPTTSLRRRASGPLLLRFELLQVVLLELVRDRLDTDENAYFGTARRRSCPLCSRCRQRENSLERFKEPACTTRRYGRQISDIYPTCPSVLPLACKRLKSVALPVRDISRFERRSSHCASRHRPAEKTAKSEPSWQSALRDIRVEQPTELLQCFTAIASVAVCSVLRVRTPGRLFEAHKANQGFHRIFWPRATTTALREACVASSHSLRPPRSPPRPSRRSPGACRPS